MMFTPLPAASRQAPRGGQGNLGAARRFLGSPKRQAASQDDETTFVDDPDFASTTPWSLDELDGSADLGSVRSAWAGNSDGRDQ